MMDGTLALWITDLFNYGLTSPFAWLAFAFTLWMLIDAIRREEWLWVVFIILFPLFNAVLYFILVYRHASPLPLPAGRFELPGSVDRRRIKELEAQIHHLDKAHHHSQLGDIYFQQGKFEKAETCYRNAFERDPEDVDTRAHLGQCLLRLGRPKEALPWLEQVCASHPKHDYGYTLMALAETYGVLGEKDKAMATWQHVIDNYSYARARVELAELHLASGNPALAKAKLEEAVADDVHAPAFERRHERFWIKRAKKLLVSLRSA